MTPPTPETLSQRMFTEAYVSGIAGWDDMIDEVAKMELRLAEAENPWWQAMSVGDIAAELSATFDISLPVCAEIAEWILTPPAALAPKDDAQVITDEEWIACGHNLAPKEKP